MKITINSYNAERNEYVAAPIDTGDISTYGPDFRFDPFVCSLWDPTRANELIGKTVEVIDYFWSTGFPRVLLINEPMVIAESGQA
jgi:hypothetical protein